MGKPPSLDLIRVLKEAAIPALLLLSVAACSKRPQEQARRTQPVPVTVSICASVADQSGNSAYSASVGPFTQVDVAFKVSGYVNSILQVKDTDGKLRNAQSGDSIRAGQLLASVQEDTYRQRVNQATSELASARASFAKARRDLERDKSLLANGVISQATYDASERQFKADQARVQGDEAVLQHSRIDLADCKLKSPIDGVVKSGRSSSGRWCRRARLASR